MTAPADLDPRLGLALRGFRERRGVTQEDLAHDADLTTTALSRVERGKSNPSWTTVTRMLRALDVTLAELETAIEQVNR